jgi:hypothetical protein
MAKYIKCDCCGKRIYFGEEIYKFGGYAGLFCSSDCFADSYGEVQELDDEIAYDCFHKVYDDEEEVALKREIEQTKADIASLQVKLTGLVFDLANIANS